MLVIFCFIICEEKTGSKVTQLILYLMIAQCLCQLFSNCFKHFLRRVYKMISFASLWMTYFYYTRNRIYSIAFYTYALVMKKTELSKPKLNYLQVKICHFRHWQLIRRNWVDKIHVHNLQEQLMQDFYGISHLLSANYEKLCAIVR